VDIAALRLSAQHIAQADFISAKAVVRHMGAMQAQDYAGALWSIALRTPHLTRVDVEKAIENREIVRTWPMRGTLHFLAAEDVRWMVGLLAPRAIALAAGRRKQLEIDDTVINKSKDIITEALAGGNCRTRIELCQILEQKGVKTAEQRGLHILHYLAETGLLCFGPHDGKQPTFVLVDEWLPPTPAKTREEALAELAKRYFISHGPASLRDFAGWGTMTMTDAKLALSLAASSLAEETVDGITYWFDPNIKPATSATFLLPGFDEYMLGYKDRSAALASEHANTIVPGGNGMFLPTVVQDGHVVATWKKTVRSKSQHILVTPFTASPAHELALLEPAVRRYEQYSGLTTTIEVTA
jgi:hypothetical protein